MKLQCEPVRQSVSWFLGLSVLNSLKITLPCFYRSTWIAKQINLNITWLKAIRCGEKIIHPPAAQPPDGVWVLFPDTSIQHSNHCSSFVEMKSSAHPEGRVLISCPYKNITQYTVWIIIIARSAVVTVALLRMEYETPGVGIY